MHVGICSVHMGCMLHACNSCEACLWHASGICAMAYKMPSLEGAKCPRVSAFYMPQRPSAHVLTSIVPATLIIRPLAHVLITKNA